MKVLAAEKINGYMVESGYGERGNNPVSDDYLKILEKEAQVMASALPEWAHGQYNVVLCRPLKKGKYLDYFAANVEVTYKPIEPILAVKEEEPAPVGEPDEEVDEGVMEWLTCKECGHKWMPRADNPKVCPKCRTKDWK